MDKVKAVFYTDGSCRGNPGFGGYGVFGYIFKDSTRSKNIKHPVHNTINFTSTGLSKEKGQDNIEVTHIVEIIRSLNNPMSTNNEAELNAVLHAFKKAAHIPNLTSLTIYTDSNYIVSAYNENLTKWIENNWKRQDNKQIVHIAEWSVINGYRKAFAELGIDIKLIWIKGHSDNYGNNISDLYSIIGSNYAKQNLTVNNTDFNVDILDRTTTYSEYKKSYIEKDIVFFFRDLYFSSNKLNDVNYCFLSTSDNPNYIGKRDTSSIFISNIGFVPDIINRLKDVYRKADRNYVTTCCIKLNKFDNKDLYRLAHIIDVEKLIVKTDNIRRTVYSVVGDSSPFMYENSVDYPFIINASNLFTKMTYIDDEEYRARPNVYVKDITDRIVREGKIVISNKEKDIDLSSLEFTGIELKQKLILNLGYDIPNYLSLKNIEESIHKVNLILEVDLSNNLCTVYINIEMSDRNIYSVNIENKYLCLKTNI